MAYVVLRARFPLDRYPHPIPIQKLQCKHYQTGQLSENHIVRRSASFICAFRQVQLRS